MTNHAATMDNSTMVIQYNNTLINIGTIVSGSSHGSYNIYLGNGYSIVGVYMSTIITYTTITRDGI